MITARGLFALLFLSGVAFAGCKGTPSLNVSYEGVGMVISGKHLFLLVCKSGEIEYDNGEHQTESRRKKGRLTVEQQLELMSLLNEAGTRALTGKYFGVVGVRDHAEWVDVTIFRPGGKQKFTAADFYGDTEKTYPAPLVTFLCRIDKLRTSTGLRMSDSFCLAK